MTDLFAARPTSQQPFAINKAYLRGAIWAAALAAFVLLPKPSQAADFRAAGEAIKEVRSLTFGPDWARPKPCWLPPAH